MPGTSWLFLGSQYFETAFLGKLQEKNPAEFQGMIRSYLHQALWFLEFLVST